MNVGTGTAEANVNTLPVPIVGQRSKLDDDLSARLQTEYVICKVSTTRFGVTKALGEQAVIRAAELFDAESKSIKASKRLLDTQHPAYKKVTTVMSRVKGLHTAMTIKFENNERLMKAEAIPQFAEAMQSLQNDLDEALRELDAEYQQMRVTAREDLGDLFDSRDYPSEINSAFEFNWSTYVFKVPESIKLLSPDLYNEQCRRLAQRFEDAAVAAEEAMAAELQELIGHIFERLQPVADGEKPKQFRESSLTNMQDFLQRFRQLGITGNDTLTTVVDQAELMIRGIDAKDVRGDVVIRQSLKERSEALQEQIDGMLVAMPKRKIRTEELE